MELIDELKSAWPARFALQPKNQRERHDVIEIQTMKKEAAMEIERLTRLINEHNERPNCPKQWMIDI